MKAVGILQVRTTSSRLPGKALLPINGYPSAVLAALRAANRGLQIIAATSTDDSDHELVHVFLKFGVPVFRGPLNNVLARYCRATANMADDTVIVRLTGDNLVPDGDFIQQLLEAFASSDFDYMTPNPPGNGLPYGLSAEAFSVATLRKAHSAATSAYDREHVTPWIYRNTRCGSYTPAALEHRDFGHLRCTIDDEEDYQRIVELFNSTWDPIQITWRDLIDRLASSPKAPSFRVPFRVVQGRVHSEFTLGTAQLGMEYGIANRSGKPSRSSAVSIVRRAISHGVTCIDTARAYQDAESVLGEALRGAWRSRTQVVTKLDPLASCSSNSDSIAVRFAVEQSIETSCRELGTNHLPVVLLHRWQHRKAWDGAVWQQLLELQAKGRVGVLGASVYAPQEALEALEDPEVKHVQLPMNVLDWRWRASGVDRAAAGRPDITIHARSAFLQGALLLPQELWPPGNYDAGEYVAVLKILAERFERTDVADLCLAYLRSQAWITSIVVGCETSSQLERNLALCCRPKLTEEQCAELEGALPRAPETLLNPSKWTIAHEERPAC